MSLVSLADAKTYLGLTGSDNDTVIQNMLDGIDKRFEAYCKRRLVSTTLTETLDGSGKTRLWLPQPAESITSVHVSANQEWTAANLVDASEYDIIPDHGNGRADGIRLQRYDYEIWEVGRLNIRVVFLAGFATPPADLVEAAKVQFAFDYQLWDAQKKGFNIVKSNSEEGWNATFLPHTELHPMAAALLDSSYWNGAY